MSVAPRRAIYGKLAGDSTLNNLLGTPAPGHAKNIYYQHAPSAAKFPYVIISKQAGTPRYTLRNRAYDNDIWLVKGIDMSAKAGEPGTADTVDAIASRIDTLLTDATLSISGRTQLYLRRESDVDYPEAVDGSLFRHAGSNFRLVYE